MADLTCDSMGEYNVYYTPPLDKPLFTSIDKRLIGLPGKVLRLNGIPLHLPRNGEEYYVAFLDTGAYQDMLAMNHNRISRRVEVVIDYCNNRVCISVEKPYTIPVYQ